MRLTVVALTMMLCLTGCVGATVALPYKQTYPSQADQPLRLNASPPVIRKTQKSDVTRQWCGITVWALIVPIPLQLPVCESYSEEAYGADANGEQVILFNTKQRIRPTLYACGPIMILGSIASRYEGNAFCGSLPWSDG
ncbi:MULTISPECIES: hypothetical protein [Pseudomonas]|uniref:hypothetical protein n=1 Tax=Pseudomonas TaxID=286 RepID=UPI0005EB0D3B|nr:MULTISPECIES: hypothetical protein [Pseudomonas]KJK09417.1 hypothetical protein UB47_02425 [Pseudomonas sp. 5]MDD1976480.1 hypothetical protein [Pseudomonas putida]